jgi:acyl-CoA synthetase (NDP forming)
METESNTKDLDRMFNPCSIAVVGASATNVEDSWVKRLLIAGYTGQIYPINPKATEILGIKAYPSIMDIPEQVDYAIFNVPAYMTIDAMADCVKKGVKFVHCYAAGFDETGLPEGTKLQAQLVKMARDARIRILGPNCMGIYCPSSGMSFNRDFPTDKGPVAFV